MQDHHTSPYRLDANALQSLRPEGPLNVGGAMPEKPRFKNDDKRDKELDVFYSEDSEDVDVVFFRLGGVWGLGGVAAGVVLWLLGRWVWVFGLVFAGMVASPLGFGLGWVPLWCFFPLFFFLSFRFGGCGLGWSLAVGGVGRLC